MLPAIDINRGSCDSSCNDWCAAGEQLAWQRLAHLDFFKSKATAAPNTELVSRNAFTGTMSRSSRIASDFMLKSCSIRGANGKRHSVPA